MEADSLVGKVTYDILCYDFDLEPVRKWAISQYGTLENSICVKNLKEAGADKSVLTLRSFDALAKMANGQATKIIVPSNLQDLATLGTTISEMFKEKK